MEDTQAHCRDACVSRLTGLLQNTTPAHTQARTHRQTVANSVTVVSANEHDRTGQD
jgi:hypothetical protein